MDGLTLWLFWYTWRGLRRYILALGRVRAVDRVLWRVYVLVASVTLASAWVFKRNKEGREARGSGFSAMDMASGGSTALEGV